MQGVKRELTPQQKTLQKDYHDSQRRGLSTEGVEHIEEKNVPTSPEKWARAKAAAKSKFAVYPSAYANGWASKKYKAMGGGWKSVGEEVEVIDELSNELLGSYKKKAGEQASAADKAGDFKKGNKRFSGIVKATKKQFDNDVKEETLDELNKDTLKNYLNKSTEVRKDSKSELKDIEKRPEMYKDNTGRDQQNIATRANKLKTTINKRTTGLNRAFNKLHGVSEDIYQDGQAPTQTSFDGANAPDNTEPTTSKIKTEMSKSARMIKALYKHHNVKEELYDGEKEDKSVATYGKKPKMIQTKPEDNFGDNVPQAGAILTGGKTLTGQNRDTLEIDPELRRPTRPDGKKLDK
jgi:hypothetical protein